MIKESKNKTFKIKKFKFVRDLKTGENITSKRMRISRIPCPIPWKMLILVERKDEKHKWFRAIKYIHYYFGNDDKPIIIDNI
jgi:hypothetical protein